MYHLELHLLTHSFPTRRVAALQTMVHFRRSVAPGAIFKRGRKGNQVVIARSDGTVAIDDSYIPALDWYSGAPVHAMESHRSEEHTSELQSLMRISYAVFCLKKKQQYTTMTETNIYRYKQ